MTPSIVCIYIIRFNEVVYLKFFLRDFAILMKITKNVICKMLNVKCKMLKSKMYTEKVIANKTVLFERNLSTNETKNI